MKNKIEIAMRKLKRGNKNPFDIEAIMNLTKRVYDYSSIEYFISKKLSKNMYVVQKY